MENSCASTEPLLGQIALTRTGSIRGKRYETYRRISTGIGSGRGVPFIVPSFGIGREDSLDFIADAAEDGDLLLFGAGCMGGIIERKVVAIDLAGKQGAGLIGIAAYGDHRLDVVVQEFVEMLGTMMADIDADLIHDADGERVDVACGV